MNHELLVEVKRALAEIRAEYLKTYGDLLKSSMDSKGLTVQELSKMNPRTLSEFRSLKFKELSKDGIEDHLVVSVHKDLCKMTNTILLRRIVLTLVAERLRFVLDKAETISNKRQHEKHLEERKDNESKRREAEEENKRKVIYTDKWSRNNER